MLACHQHTEPAFIHIIPLQVKDTDDNLQDKGAAGCNSRAPQPSTCQGRAPGGGLPEQHVGSLQVLGVLHAHDEAPHAMQMHGPKNLKHNSNFNGTKSVLKAFATA
jgi:hypothetical protein